MLNRVLGCPASLLLSTSEVATRKFPHQGDRDGETGKAKDKSRILGNFHDTKTDDLTLIMGLDTVVFNIKMPFKGIWLALQEIIVINKTETPKNIL